MSTVCCMVSNFVFDLLANADVFPDILFAKLVCVERGEDKQVNAEYTELIDKSDTQKNQSEVALFRSLARGKDADVHLIVYDESLSPSRIHLTARYLGSNYTIDRALKSTDIHQQESERFSWARYIATKESGFYHQEFVVAKFMLVRC